MSITIDFCSIVRGIAIATADQSQPQKQGFTGTVAPARPELGLSTYLEVELDRIAGCIAASNNSAIPPEGKA
jgi:hypothetical protein